MGVEFRYDTDQTFEVGQVVLFLPVSPVVLHGGEQDYVGGKLPIPERGLFDGRARGQVHVFVQIGPLTVALDARRSDHRAGKKEDRNTDDRSHAPPS